MLNQLTTRRTGTLTFPDEPKQITPQKGVLGAVWEADNYTPAQIRSAKIQQMPAERFVSGLEAMREALNKNLNNK